MKKLSVFIGILVSMFLISGCASKPNSLDVNKNSTEIILNYSKKTLPDGWVWNFGVGKNYSSALEDAAQALTFESATSFETKVIVSGKEIVTKDSYGNQIRIPAHKIMDTRGKNKYNFEHSCELHKLLNTNDGMLIIRICKDFNYFEKEQEKNIDKKYYHHSMNSINLYFNLNEIKGKYSKEDLRIISIFLDEINNFKQQEIWWNFPSNSKEDIENFVLTTYKTWINQFPMDSFYKNYYGIIYPYNWEMDRSSGKKVFSQVWEFEKYPGYKFSFYRKISEPQLIGLTEIDESYKGFRLVRN